MARTACVCAALTELMNPGEWTNFRKKFSLVYVHFEVTLEYLGEEIEALVNMSLWTQKGEQEGDIRRTFLH